MIDPPAAPIVLRLYDPSRRPLDWTAQLSASQYAVFLSDSKLGYELTAEGMPKERGEPSYCLVFNSLAAGEAFCRAFVEKAPNGRCDIYDHEGKAKSPVAIITHPRHAGRVPSRRSAFGLFLLAAVMVLPTPLLFWIDWRHRGTLIVPTLVGLNLLAAVVRISMWGWGMMEAVRASEKRRGYG
jgi:hypothetical protein